MITKQKGKEIKALVGYGYANKFLEYFRDNKLYQVSGDEYGVSAVRNWINGREEVSDRLEGFCLQAVQHFKAEKQKRIDLKKQILADV